MSRINKANLLKTIYYCKKNGVKNTVLAAWERMQPKEWDDYTYVAPWAEALLAQRATKWKQPIVFSIVVPTYHTKAEYFRTMVESVLAQTYPYFELILADASEDDSVEALARTYNDERVRFVKLSENAGIADNTNAGIAEATGEYIALLDHDDLLTVDALYHMAIAIQERIERGKESILLYSDEDKCDGEGKVFYEPHFKKDFDLDLFLTNNFICHFTVIRADVVKELLLRKEYDGAQDFDLFLRVVDFVKGEYDRITHIPKILYHWRCHMGSTAANPESKRYAYEAGLRAIEDFASKQGWQVNCSHRKHLGFYRMEYEPDVFAERSNVAAVGGRILAGKHLIGGMMDEEGNVLYEGLRDGFSGYVNRASLTQQALCLDIRCLKLRQECQELFEQVVGVQYRERQVRKRSIFDARLLPKGCDVKMLSLNLCKALREKGYVLLWEPEVVVDENNGDYT